MARSWIALVGIVTFVFACWTFGHQEPTSAPLVEASNNGLGAGPVSSYKQKVFEDAIQGLRYESGRAVVDTENPRQSLVNQGFVGRNPNEAKVRFDAGHQFLKTNNNVLGAIGAFTEAILLDPDEASYYVGLGTGFLWKKMRDLAEASFRTAVDLDEDLIEGRLQLGWLLNSRTMRSQAIQQWQHVVDLDPDNGEAHSGLARAHYYLQDFDRARQHTRAATRLGTPLPPQFVKLLEEDGNAEDTIPVTRGGGLTVGPQVRVDLGGGTTAANETSIGASSFSPDEVVATWNDYRSAGVRMGVSVSLDGGTAWTDFLVRPPVANQSSVEGDPMTAYDNRTGTLWIGAISFAGNGGLYVAKKQPGSTQFDPSVQIGQLSFADKGWMAAGRPPGNPNATNLYIAYNEGVIRSTDMGLTFNSPVSVPGGLGFLPRVGPTGTLYVAYSDSTGISLLKSTNSGNTLDNPITVATRMDPFIVGGEQVPGIFRVAGLPGFGVDHNDGTLYCVYPDSTGQVGVNTNVDIYFTKSMNDGVTWTTPSIIDIDGVNTGDQFFPWLEVDDSGNLHLLYYDTQNTIQDDTDTDGFVDAYYGFSNDGGSSWTLARLTPAPFNSRFDGRGDPGSQFIGDYLGLAYAANRAYPCYLSNQNGDADIFVHNIETGPEAFELSLTSLTPGEDATISIVGAEPNSDVVIHWSRDDTGMNPCPPEYGGLCLDLLGNVRALPTRTVDNNGRLTITRPVPTTIPVDTVVFCQVVNVLGVGGADSVKSNVIGRRIRKP